MSILETFRKRKPVFTGIARGIGGFGIGGGGGGPVSYQVSGGTLVQEGVSARRTHTMDLLHQVL